MSYTIRMATVDDAGAIARHRAAMFLEMRSITPAQAEIMRETSIPWHAKLLAHGGYFGWLIEHESAIIAGGGVLLREMGPTPGCLEVCEWAHIVNVYTEPAHRRRGLARRLMQAMIEWCDARAIPHVTLAASDDGRPLYESLGFVPTNEMRLPRTSAARSQSCCETS